jgi:hypothetical protein
MLKQSNLLSGKIMIAAEYDKPAYSEKYLWFYTKYSCFTLRALNKSSFQKFLGWMLAIENIKETTVNSVDVKVFPDHGENGHVLAGRCDTYGGKIRIYPKSINFCKAFRKKFGKKILFTYAGNRARAALIHELLHLKYTSNEEKVRELTKVYFSTYTKKQTAQKSTPISIYKLIFDVTSTKKEFRNEFDSQNSYQFNAIQS